MSEPQVMRPRPGMHVIAAGARFGIDPNKVREAVQALMLEHPELAEDEELRLNTIEGETDTYELLTLVLEQIRSAQAMQEAINLRMREIDGRRKRYEVREEFARKLAFRIMEAAELRKVQLPEATLSIRPSPPGVRIINPELIPEDFMRVKKEPNLTSIKAALKAGERVDGAALSNAQDTLAVLTR